MIKIEVNNRRCIEMTQIHNGSIVVKTKDSEGIVDDEYIIDEGDFVMLLNYYRYQKDNGEEIF